MTKKIKIAETEVVRASITKRLTLELPDKRVLHIIATTFESECEGDENDWNPEEESDKKIYDALTEDQQDEVYELIHGR